MTITSFSLNPHNCLFTVTLHQTGESTGGTGQFTGLAASSTGTVSAQGLLPRTPDGCCSFDQATREEDMIASSGKVSF